MDRRKLRDLLTNERSSRVVPDFLASMVPVVGMRVPAVEEPHARLHGNPMIRRGGTRSGPRRSFFCLS